MPDPTITSKQAPWGEIWVIDDFPLFFSTEGDAEQAVRYGQLRAIQGEAGALKKFTQLLKEQADDEKTTG